VAIGTILSFTFIAAQWAGDMIGHQMGLNISEVFDPQFGASGSIVGDMYVMLILVIFLAVGGHRDMLIGVRQSFDALPLLSVGVNKPLLDLLVGLFTGASCLAVQLAGPMLVTMLIVDLSLGCISKTMPQLNVMTAGLSVRSVVGMLVLIVGLYMTTSVLNKSINENNQSMWQQYTTLRPR
jgi:flagellar biosynthesis protein FliR